MPVEEFQAYWRQEHAVIIRQLPGVRRYVQSHPLIDTYREEDPVFDGVAELWADDTQSFRNMAASEAYADVQVDEEKFLERHSTALILTDEYFIKYGPAAAHGIKCIDFMCHHPEMSIEEFQHYWREVHAPVVAGLPLLRRYVQSHVRSGAYAKGRRPIYDGFESKWYDTADSMVQTTASTDYAVVKTDEMNFIIPGDRHTLVTREVVVID